MPRRSPSLIEMRDGERERLESVARRHTSSCCDLIRGKAVPARGLSDHKTDRRLKKPRQIVSKWWKRYYTEGMAGLHDRPRGGRPPSFLPEVVVEVKALA